MKKHFEAFQDFIESLKFKFTAISFSVTWLQPHEISDTNFQLPGYYSFHITRKNSRGGEFCIFSAGNLFIQIQKRPLGKF